MPEVDWKWVIPTILMAAAAIAEIYGHFLRNRIRNWKETGRRRDRFLARVAQALQELLSRVYECRPLEIYTIQVPEAPAFEPEFTYSDLLLGHQIENPLVSKKTSARLKMISELTSQYKDWRSEVLFIANTILSQELERREQLKAKWDCLVKQGYMRPLEAEIEDLAYPLLLRETFNLNEVKQAFIDKFGPDWVKEVHIPKVQVGMGIFGEEKKTGEEQIKLREHILDTGDFHRLMEELGKVTKRPSFGEFRKIQYELSQQIENTLRSTLGKKKMD